MTTWWWNQQYRAQSSTLVLPPLAWWVMWWTSQPDAGWSQPLGNRQCLSRWITARRIAAGMSRLTPTFSGRLGPANRAPSCSRRKKLASPPGPDTRATALPMIFRSRASRPRAVGGTGPGSGTSSAPEGPDDAEVAEVAGVAGGAGVSGVGSPPGLGSLRLGPCGLWP